MSDTENDRAVQADIERILGELAQRAYAGEIKGIAVAIVTDYGFICQHAHFDKQKGSLLAMVTLLQHDIIHDFRLQFPQPIDGD
jgi:hypothetical protein